MNPLTATFMTLALLAAPSTSASQATGASGPGTPPSPPVPDSQTIHITRSGSQPSRNGPAENFTGSVRIIRCSRRTSRHGRLART